VLKCTNELLFCGFVLLLLLGPSYHIEIFIQEMVFVECALGYTLSVKVVLSLDFRELVEFVLVQE